MPASESGSPPPERTAAERDTAAALREAEERLDLLARATHNAVWEWDVSTGRIWCNAEYEQLFGTRPESARHSTEWWENRIHPDDRERTVRSLREAIDGAVDSWVAEYRIRARNGRYAYVRDRACILRDEGGRARRMVGAADDLTREKRAEAAELLLLRRMQRHRRVLDEVVRNAPAAICIVRGPDFVYDMVNPAYQALAPGKRMVGKTFAEVWPELPPSVLEGLREVMRTGRPLEVVDTPLTVRRRPKQPPEEIYITYRSIPLPGPDGHPDRILTVGVETTGIVLQRQRLESALALDEAILCGMAEGLMIADAAGRVVQANAEAVRFHRWKAPQAALRRWDEFGEFELQDASGRLLPVKEWPLARALRGETFREMVLRVTRKDTRERWIGSYAGAPIKDADGNVKLAVITFRDVTEECGLRLALAIAERRQRLALESAAMGTWTWNIATGELDCDARAKALFGYAAHAEVRYDLFVQSVHPDDRGLLPLAGRRHVSGSGEYDVEFQVTRADGALRWMRAKGRARRHFEDEPDHIYGVIFDITERKDAERVLHESEERSRRLIESSPCGIALVDAAGAVLYANQSLLRTLGCTEEDVAEGTIRWTDVAPARFAAAEEAALKELNRTGTCSPYQTALLTRDGRCVPVLASAARLRESDPSVRVMFIMDMTELELAEAALRESEARERARAAEWEAIMDAVPAAILVSRDPECRVVVGSRMSSELLRVPPGANLSTTAPEGERPTHFRTLQNGVEMPAGELPVQLAARTGREIRDYEFDLQFDDGTTRHLMGNAVPLIDENGRPRGALAAFLDVTQHHIMERRLRESHLLESVGLLAGGVAHDFNNLLVAILGNASLARDMLPPGSSIAPFLDDVVTSGEAAAHLTRELLAYSGKGQFVVQPIDVVPLIESAAALVRPSLPKGTRLDLHIARSLPRVEADGAQMRQLVTNLLLNAGEAVAEKPDGHILVFADCDGPQVRIRVRDNGCGIDDSIKTRIFEPFFTTNFMGRGLGLAAVAGIVRAHNGTITVESEPGQGSTFTVVFPAIAAAATS